MVSTRRSANNPHVDKSDRPSRGKRSIGNGLARKMSDGDGGPPRSKGDTIAFSDLVRLHESLRLTSIPRELPCVGDNYKAIRSCLLQAVCCNRGDTLYVSGVPGTGKTLTVTSVILDLRKTIPFEYVFINAMHYSESVSVYSELWERISSNRVSPKKAADRLREFFSGSNTLSSPLVIVIDELDVLVTRNQEVIYNILDWPNFPNSNVIVVAIANTADLPERLLKNRVSSRLGPNHVKFRAYTHQQLIKIAQSRMLNEKVFDNNAIEYCSRKVASLSGDARKLLNLLRKAIELYENHTLITAAELKAPLEKIGINWIDAALKISYQSNSLRHLSSLSFLQKALLTAYVRLYLNSPSSPVTLDSLIHEYNDLLSLCPHLHFTVYGVYDLLSSLIEKRILVTDQNSFSCVNSTLVLNFPMQDILSVLRSDHDRLLTPLTSTLKCVNPS